MVIIFYSLSSISLDEMLRREESLCRECGPSDLEVCVEHVDISVLEEHGIHLIFCSRRVWRTCGYSVLEELG